MGQGRTHTTRRLIGRQSCYDVVVFSGRGFVLSPGEFFFVGSGVLGF